MSESSDAKLADQILRRFSASAGAAERPKRAQSNSVWMVDDVVLRLSNNPGQNYLKREALLAAKLPSEVGYPRVTATGEIDGRCWMVTERLRGSPLLAAWPDLSNDARVRALESLWHRLEWVHRTPVEIAIASGCTDTPLYALDRTTAMEQLKGFASNDMIDVEIHDALQLILERAFSAMTAVPRSLTHTDAGIHNALWDGRETILLDFEFACVAPNDLDLEMLFRGSLGKTEPTASRLRELAAPLLGEAGSAERLKGYAVLRDLWAFGHWKRHFDSRRDGDPWPPDDVTQWRPWQLLHEHARSILGDRDGQILPSNGSGSIDSSGDPWPTSRRALTAVTRMRRATT